MNVGRARERLAFAHAEGAGISRSTAVDLSYFDAVAKTAADAESMATETNSRRFHAAMLARKGFSED